jgi:hypothetical protein
MGTKKRPAKTLPPPISGIADALFSKVQQRVLAVLFENPGRSFCANEVIALAGSGTGAVQRELACLEAAGLVTVTRVGNQKHYQANAAAPVFEELRGLVLKTSGLADVLRGALAPLSANGTEALHLGFEVAEGRGTPEIHPAPAPDGGGGQGGGARPRSETLARPGLAHAGQWEDVHYDQSRRAAL